MKPPQTQEPLYDTRSKPQKVRDSVKANVERIKLQTQDTTQHTGARNILGKLSTGEERLTYKPTRKKRTQEAPPAETAEKVPQKVGLLEGGGLGTHGGVPSQVTADLLIEKLEEFKGNITSMCRFLRCSRQTFYDYMKKFPNLKEAAKDINEAEIDTAEEKLNELIDKRNLTAIIFKLKCKGRHRGWIDRPEGDGGGKASQLVVQIFPVNGGPPMVSNVKGGNAKYTVDRDIPALLAYDDKEAVMDAEFFDGPATPLEVNE